MTASETTMFIFFRHCFRPRFVSCRTRVLALVWCFAASSIHAGQTPTPQMEFSLDARSAVARMTPGINIGNTFDNTYQWETGWGSPRITREYIESLAGLGFKTVRLPVAWDTYAEKGRITPEQFQRVGEVAGWILDAGMFCVLNIHWDGGWIDSGSKERFPTTHHTFSAEAEAKFRSYWQQIATHFAQHGERLLFEGLNEETNFDNGGSVEKAYATLTRVNQLFLDTVRGTGGNNAQRLLIVPGYSTDIGKTCHAAYQLPKDALPGRLFLSIHYYTPWPFVGMKEDASWAKMQPTWGSEGDLKQLNELFDQLNEFSARHDTPVFLGEFAVCSDKDKLSRVRWTSSVLQAATKRNMVPVLWDTGGAVSRKPPFTPHDELVEVLRPRTAIQD
jgi:endoglucanase